MEENYVIIHRWRTETRRLSGPEKHELKTPRFLEFLLPEMVKNSPIKDALMFIEDTKLMD